MSLLNDFSETYTIMEKVRTADGEGGNVVSWQAGATVVLSRAFDSSLAARIAEKDGVKSVFKFYGAKNCGLAFHDVIKATNGEVYRITTNPGDAVTPAAASFDLTMFTAEAWALT